MSQGVLGTPVQGGQDYGETVAEYPVLVTVEDAAGNVGTLKLTAAGALPVDASGSPAATVTANQGTPNAAGANSWPVQGAAAANAALAGNPIRTGISDGTKIQDWKQATATAGSITPTGIAQVSIALYDNASNFRALGNANQTDAVGLSQMLSVVDFEWNGATADKHRNNVDVTALASASRTTTQTINVTTYNIKGITVILDMTLVGTASVTVTIDGQDPASGKFYNLLTGLAITNNSTNVYRIQPGLTAVANKDVNCQLPRTIRIVVTANNANPGTYSLGYTLHN